MSQKGFTVLELTTSALLGATLVLLVGGAFRLARTDKDRMDNRTSSQAELTVLTNHILRVGRFAGNAAGTCGCVYSANTLECCVNFNNPPSSGATTQVRFRFDSATKRILYEKNTAGTWGVETTYPNITAFTVCSDTEMSAGTCTLVPTKISTEHATNRTGRSGLPASPAGRYFRLLVSSRNTAGTGITQEAQNSFQTSFFVRNPIATGSVVQW